MKKNVLLTIAYDGSGFHGWQRQPKARTVQGYLEETMTRLFKREIILKGTSRTDAGVHALGQRASFETDINIPVEKLPMVVNNALCAREGRETGRGGFAKSPVRILEAREMDMGFHARFDSKGKEYVYRICDGTAKKGAGELSMIFERNYLYHVKESLDLEAMKAGAAFLEGRQDFKSFEAAGGNPRETTVRTIFGAEFVEVQTGIPGFAEGDGRRLDFHIKGDGFLYNMVRIITGTLVEVGQGKKRPEDIKRIIEACDRKEAGHTAPPGGLYLKEIYY